MADRKISDLTALTTPAAGDYLPIVDISEPSNASKNKRITIEELLRGAPDGTAAAPGIAFESDPDTGIYSPGANTLAFAEGGVEAARIDSSGRLLVGTSSARANFYNSTLTSLFQVESATGTRLTSFTYGDTGNTGPIHVLAKHRSASVGGTTIVAAGDQLGTLSFQGSDGTEFVAGAEITAAVDGTPGANDMPGRLVFSTTADGASSPTEALRIINSGRHEIGSTQQGILCGVTSAAGTTTAVFVAKNSITKGNVSATGTDALLIWSNGNVVNTNNSYGAISDIKLKENIIDANSQWDDIKTLQVRNYNFKEGQTHTQIGLIAQEVELVSPGLVSESPDLDEDGNDLGTVTKSVNYSVLYMKAVKALQEAMERIEVLEAKVNALEGN